MNSKVAPKSKIDNLYLSINNECTMFKVMIMLSTEKQNFDRRTNNFHI